jgi:hypothetical protein
MKILGKESVEYLARTILVLSTMIGFVASGSSARAQSAGNNVVCNSIGACTSSTGWTPSTAFVDAFGIDTTTTDDLCLKINKALAVLPAAGGVVDARGLNSGNTHMTCAVSTTPWLQAPGGVTTFTTTPADILLPAGQICIQSRWILPDRTRVFGAGIWGSGTYIYAAKVGNKPAGCSTFTSTFSDSEMIDLGYNGTPTGYPSAPCPTSSICSGVSVDGLDLDGSGLSNLGGIVNTNSENLSYVNQVTFHELFGTALSSSAPGVGRYTNFQNGQGTNFDAETTTECIALSQASGVGGVHGMTCTGGPTSTTTAPYVAMSLGSASNSMEDLHFEGFYAGIVVVGVGNLLLNVEAATSSIGPGTDGVYICGPSSASPPCPTSSVSATDTVALGISSGGSASLGFPNTLQDDVTVTTLAHSTNPSVAMYVLGQPVPSSSTTSFSRFSTSPTYPTWGAASSTPGTTCSSPGSVYSNWSTTYTGSANTIWVCVGTTWTALK